MSTVAPSSSEEALYPSTITPAVCSASEKPERAAGNGIFCPEETEIRGYESPGARSAFGLLQSFAAFTRIIAGKNETSRSGSRRAPPVAVELPPMRPLRGNGS